MNKKDEKNIKGGKITKWRLDGYTLTDTSFVFDTYLLCR